MLRLILFLMLAAFDTSSALAEDHPSARVPGFLMQTGPETWKSRGSDLGLRIHGADLAVGPLHLELLDSKAYRFHGEERLGESRLYGGVAAPNPFPIYRAAVASVYPGIQLRISLERSVFKSEYIVAPGADPNSIQFRYGGAAKASLVSGDLLIETGSGAVLREPAPTIFQDTAGGRQAVSGRYVLHQREAGWFVSFELGSYDPALPLVIDPYVLGNGLYLGGSGIDHITGVAADATGVYVCGWTEASDFPTSPVRARSSGVEAFVVKLNPQANQILWATYLGGSLDDRALGIAVDTSGQVRVAGTTSSYDFPALSAHQGAAGGGSRDGFVAKLTSTGALSFSTYFGGSGVDSINGVAVMSSGETWVAGETTSTNLSVLSPYQSLNAGSADAFAAKFSSTGTLMASTYLGGSGNDQAFAIAVDSFGAAYLTGGTYSTNFPRNASFQGYRGGQDAFVSKLSSNGASLVYSTLLGGSEREVGGLPEEGTSIAVAASGIVSVVGTTCALDFPLVQPTQSLFGGGNSDAFLARISANGSQLLSSSYYGGNSTDEGSRVVLGSDGSVYFAGLTSSDDLKLVEPIQAGRGGSIDGFVARFDAGLTAQLWGSYLGGSSSETLTGIALTSGAVYVVGFTSSASPYQGSNLRAPIDGFVARYTETFQIVSVNATSSAFSFTVSGTDCGAGTYSGAANLSWRSGAQCSIGFTASQLGSSVRYVFTNWSDGSTANPRTFLVSPGLTSLGINVRVDYSLTRLVSPAGSGTVSASPNYTDFFYPADSSVQLTAQPASGYGFSNWTGNASGSSPVTSVLVAGARSVTANFVCQYGLNSTSLSAAASSTSQTIAVSTGAGCNWNAASPVGWLSLPVTSFANSGSVQVNFQGNTTGNARSSAITVAGQSVMVTQAGCVYSAAPSWANPMANSASSTGVTLSTGSTCGWTASSNAAWARLSVTAGTGSLGVGVVVDGNPSPAQRTATLVVAGQVLTLTQNGTPAPIPCTYSVAPNWGGSLNAAGGAVALTVTTQPSCGWSAAADTSWFRVSAPSFTGSGTVQVDIDPNASLSARSGQVLVAGQNFTVAQSGKVVCPVTLSAATLNLTATGSAASIQLTAATDCTWTAASSVPWIQVYPLSGTGNARLDYTVFPNFSSSNRSGQVTVNAAGLSVAEAGRSGTRNQRLAGAMYFNFFGRLASAPEVAFQAGVLDKGTPLGELVFNFFQTPEFNGGGRFIAGLYVGLLNRDAEYGGWLFQRNALSTALVTQNALVGNFISSAEYGAVFGSPSNDDFVRLLYRYVLLREPGPGEVAFQSGALKSGLTRIQLASNFLNSNEFRVGTGARLTVFVLYSCILQRDATFAEVEAGRARITDSASVRKMADDLTTSSEFQSALQ